MYSDNPAAAQPISILLVDDEPINLTVFGQFLAQYYEIIVATSGERALQLAMAARQPDIILLDVMMPGMDGYQVLTQLKSDPATEFIPVMLVTALNSSQDEERGLELGAADYIYKPCNLTTLLARIRTQLELKSARDWLKDQNAYLEAEVERRQQENQQLNLQLLQAEKMRAVGQLAAGIAHEINNPIGFVFSNLNTLKTYAHDVIRLLNAYETSVSHGALEPTVLENLLALKQQINYDYLLEDLPELIAESLEGVTRIRDIVRNLLEFSHPDSNAWVLADVQTPLDSALNILHNEIKQHCAIHKEYGETPKIECLQSQLAQVFMNLLINAIQAMQGRGDIYLRTGRRQDEVFVEIRDTGPGISPENLQKLFEPFFTTKPVGQGTGLGLSVSQNIIRHHQGRIEVNSSPEHGASFCVWLPIRQAKTETKLDA